MKNLTLIIFFILWTINLFGQQSLDIGIDDNPKLSKQEAELLNSFLIDTQDTFDFTDKMVGVIDGSSGQIILKKSEYFKNLVKPWTDKGLTPRIFIVILDHNEKNISGGYDVLVLAYVKLFTKKQKRRIVERLRTITCNER